MGPRWPLLSAASHRWTPSGLGHTLLSPAHSNPPPHTHAARGSCTVSTVGRSRAWSLFRMTGLNSTQRPNLLKGQKMNKRAYIRAVKLSRAGVPNPQTTDRYLVHGPLGTGPHGRRWAAGEHVKFHLPSPITTTTTPLPPLLASPPETRPRAHPWKNCLPQSWSPVPKRLGTPELDHSHHPMRNFNKLSKLWFAKIRYKFKFYMSIKAQIINREN